MVLVLAATPEAAAPFRAKKLCLLDCEDPDGIGGGTLDVGPVVGHLGDQRDTDSDGVGDVYESVYMIEEALKDPDWDNRTNRQEFYWRTIPISSANVNPSLTEETITIEARWGNDTDLDYLEDEQEYNYWNDFRNESGVWVKELNEESEASRFEWAATTETSTRDPQSLLDFDGDACDKPGNPYVPYKPDDTVDAQLKGCSHVADDADSDNDGITDGQEVAPAKDSSSPGIGRWISEGGSTDWRPGSYAWANDSDCLHDRKTVNGSQVSCVSLGNYWDTTDPQNGYFVHALEPGSGDGLADPEEKRSWNNRSTNSSTLWEWDADDGEGSYVSAWAYHRGRADWMIDDARDRALAPEEIDFDHDGAMPMLDRDSDDDGYTDLAESIPYDDTPDDPPPYIVENSSTGTAAEWRDENVPDCARGMNPLPFAADTDYDYLSDYVECGTVEAKAENPDRFTNTDPWDWDTDGDRLPDGWEDQFGLPPNQPSADGDPDNDGLSNRDEYCYRPETDLNEPDGTPWGCNDDAADDKYWDWNPCALHPKVNDTDGDGVDDGEEVSQGTNAADENATATGTSECDDNPTPDRPTPEPPDDPDPFYTNQDLDSYNDNASNAVLEGQKDAWRRVDGTTIAPLETVERAERRSEKIQSTISSKYDRLLDSLGFADVTRRADQLFEETVYTAQGVVDDVLREPITTTVHTALREVNDTAPVATPTDLREVLESDPQTLVDGDRIRQGLENPQTFARDVVNETTKPLASPNHSVTSAETPLPDGLTNAPREDPVSITQTEGVIPDRLFSLFNYVEDETGADTFWSTYAKTREEHNVEHFTDSSHYKVLAIGPNGTTNITPNTELGTAITWNVDGDDDTGADEPCGSTNLSCEVSYDTGDDLLVEVTGETEQLERSSTRTKTKPTLTIEKLDPTETFDWLAMAFMLPYTEDQNSDLLGTEDSAGYVAYAGIDGRPNSSTPTTGDLSLDADRDYEVTDLPDRAVVQLSDFSITPEAEGAPQRIADPSNEIAVNVSFSDDRDTYDTALMGGISQYKLDNDDDNKSKRIFGRGNSTNVTMVFRGTPSGLSLDYEAVNATEEGDGSTETETRTLDVNWAAEDVDPGSNDGVDLAVQRTSNEDGVRNRTSLAIVTSGLPQNGSYARNVTTISQIGADEDDRRSTERLTLSRALDDAYLKFNRWTDVDAVNEATRTLRIRSSPLPATVEKDFDTMADTYRVEASQAVDEFDIVAGSNDGTCRSLEDVGNSNMFFVAPRTTTGGCVNANLHGFRNVTTKLDRSTSAAGSIDLTYQRNESATTVTDDSAAFWIQKDQWFSAEASDLPETLNVTLAGPDADEDTLDVDYAFTPEDQIVERLDLRGALNVADQDEPADIRLLARGLPSQGRGTVNAADRQVDVSFPERLDHLQVKYAEGNEIPDLGEPRVLVQESGGQTNVNATVDGFKELTLDASNSDNLTVTGDVQDSRETLVHVDVPGEASDSAHDFDLSLSKLPGTFNVTLQNTDDTFDVEGNVSTGASGGDPTGSIASTHLLGRVGSRHYNVTLEDLQVFDVHYAREDYALGAIDTRSLDVRANFSQPTTIEGRINDVGTDLSGDAFPAAPASIRDHIMRVEDADGSAMLSFQFTGVQNGSIGWERTRGSDQADIGSWKLDVGYNLSQPRSLLVYQKEKPADDATVEEPAVFVGRVDALPATVDVDARSASSLLLQEGKLSYTASDPVDEATVHVDDPTEQIKLDGRLRDLPRHVNATWPDTDPLPDQVQVRVNHSGQAPLGEAFLEYEDDDPDRRKYVRAHVRDLPANATVVGDTSSPIGLNATVRDQTGALAPLGLLDVRLQEDETNFAVPCPNADCSGRGFLRGDLTGDTPLAVGVRQQGLENVTADLSGMNQGEGGIRYQKDVTEPLHVKIDTSEAALEGNLTPLPSEGNLTYRFANDSEGRLTAMDLDWVAPEPIHEGNLSVLLKSSTDGDPGHRLDANFTSFSGLDTHLERPCSECEKGPTVLRTASTDGIGHLDLQFGPDLPEGTTVWTEPELSTSQFVLWDNQTVTHADLASTDDDSTELAGEDLIDIRAWNFQNVTFNSSNGSVHVETTRPMTRPVELVAKRHTLDADVKLANLPETATLTWDTDNASAAEGFNWTASGSIDAIEGEVTKRRASNATPEGEMLVNRFRGTLEDVPSNVTVSWNGSREVSVRIPDEGSLGSVDVLLVNLTGSHGSATPLRPPEDKQGAVLVNTTDTSLTGTDTTIDPRLKQAALRLHGLESLNVTADEGPTELEINRSSGPDVLDPANVLLANQTRFLDLQVDQLPRNVSLTFDQRNSTENLSSGGREDATNFTLDTNSSHRYRAGELIYRGKPSDDDTEEVNVEANLTFTAIPADVSLTAQRNRTYLSDDGTASDEADSGFDRATLEASTAGLSLWGELVVNGTEFRPTVSGLPAFFSSNLTADRREGTVTIPKGEVRSLELVVKPEDAGSYRSLPDGTEGVYSEETPEETSHVRFTHLENASWDLTGRNLSTDNTSVSIEHDDPEPKEVRVSVQREEDDGEANRLEASLSPLPDDWELTLTGNKTNGTLTYSASTTIENLTANWRSGPENLSASISALPPGNTSLSFDMTDGRWLRLDAETAPETVHARGTKDGTFFDLHVLGAPADLIVDADDGTKRGLVRAFDDSDANSTPSSVQRVQAFTRTCPLLTMDGNNCDQTPSDRPDPGSWDATDDAVLYHNYTDNVDGEAWNPNATNETFILAQDFEEARWNLRSSNAENWAAINLDRDSANGSRADANLTLVGTHDRPDLQAQFDVDRIATNTTALIHLPAEGVDTGGAEEDPPTGFSLANVDGVDTVEEGDVLVHVRSPSEEPNPRPNVTFETKKDLVKLFGTDWTEGLPPGSLHLEPGEDPFTSSDEDLMAGFKGRLDFAEAVPRAKLIWQRTIPNATSDVTPKSLNLTLKDVPSHVDLFGTVPEPTCVSPLDDQCNGTVGVDVDESESELEAIGKIDATLSFNTSALKSWDPAVPDGAEEGNFTSPGDNYVQVHERRPTDDNSVERNITSVNVHVRNLSLARGDVHNGRELDSANFDASRRMSFEADLTGQRSLDLQWTRTPTENESDEPYSKDLTYISLQAENVNATVDGYLEEGSSGTTKLGGSLDQSGAFDLRLGGNWPIDVNDYEAEQFTFDVDGIQDHLDLLFQSADAPGNGLSPPRPRVVADTGAIESLQGRIPLQHNATVNNQPGEPSNCETSGSGGPDSDGGGGSLPFRFRLNAQQSANGDDVHPHTDGVLWDVNLSASTPNANGVPEADNYVAVNRACGDGQDEWGVHVRARGLERAFVDTYEDTQRIETEFHNDTAEGRDFEFRYTNGTDVTRLANGDRSWTPFGEPTPWPNKVAIHIVRSDVTPSDLDLTAIHGWMLGEGGDLPDCFWATSTPDCWQFWLTKPVTEKLGGQSASGDAWFVSENQEGVRGDFEVENDKAVGRFAMKAIPQWGWKLAAEGADTATEVVMDKAKGVKDSYLEFDLDGVTGWGGERLTHVKHDGAVHVDHSAPEHSLDLDADAEGSFNGTTVYNQTVTDDQDNEQNEIRRKGSHNQANPVMDYISDNEYFDVPACAWEDGGCEDQRS